jgi:hypothetical protein
MNETTTETTTPDRPINALAELQDSNDDGDTRDYLQGWIRHLRREVTRENDALILVVGPTGRGKSSCVWWLGHALDPTFTWERMPLEQKLFFTQLMAARPGHVVCLDEGDEGTDSRTSMSKKNEAVNAYAEVCRIRRVLLFVCKPHLAWFDKKIKNDKAKFVIYVPRRSVAIVHVPAGGDVGGDTMPVDADYRGWHPLFKFRFPDPDPYGDWQAYKQVKVDHANAFDPFERAKTKKRPPRRDG